MQASDHSELVRLKSKERLSDSLDRAELIEQRVCVACRTSRSLSGLIHCQNCGARLARADWKAFAGFLAEVRRSI